MTATAHQVTRLFLVHCGPSPLAPRAASAAENVTFMELPCIPVETSRSTSDGECVSSPPQPRVSPVVHIGRQTPFLSSALQNDRSWSRALLEVTTWCIEGLPSTSCDGVSPVDAATLPFAGVRVRLCGKGRPVRVVPIGEAGDREGTTLTERGSCAWLQHGDVLELGTQAQVRLLAVHIRVGHATELAQHASFVWITSPLLKPTSCGVGGVSSLHVQPRMTAVPTALWLAGLHDWSSAPKFLKVKMLHEAEQLTLYMHEKEAYRVAKAAAETPSISACNRLGDSGCNIKGTRGPATRRAAWAESDRYTHGEEGLVTASPNCSTFGCRSSAAAAEHEPDAATPTTNSQQQPQDQRTSWATSSPSSIPIEWGPTRGAPVVTGCAPSLCAVRENCSVVAPVSLTGSPSQVQQKDGCGSETVPRSSAPPPLRSTLLQRQHHAPAVQSLTTLSETMDDMLNEALLYLENGSNRVGEALVEQREKEALLVALGEDLIGTRTSSSEEPVASTSQRTGLDDGTEDRGDLLGSTPTCKRRSLKRRREEAARGGRTSRSANRQVSRSTADGRRLSHGSQGKATCSAEVLQPVRVETATAHPPQHLTRADIRRTHSHQQPQEDSQVVFFDF
ncbi:hypothetical protein, conserved [Leishmania tarentolae]|uniref:Uncharacterized protein n=1 Tax=Leishmania tarentolae TaxID=5689 RepID=A0A640KTM6_LEITA|nr:hypothetical protein, conserved [Leishmania tarentolae]